MTDAHWAILAPLLPPPGNNTDKGGRPEKHARRLVLDAIFYLSRGGIAWRQMPHNGRLLLWARTVLSLTVEVVKRTDKVTGFVVLPRRWVVERTFGWITERRRCVRDYETLPEHHEAMIYIA